MAKTCKVDGCGYNVFSKGLCKVHQYLRYQKGGDKYQNKAIEPLSSIKRYNIPSRSKKAFRHDYFYFKSQSEMFVSIWLNTPKKDRVCWLTGDKLPDEFNLCYFAHVLNKKNYTYWKLNPHNIKLLKPDIHNKVDKFISKYYEDFPGIDWNKWFDLQEQYKIEYEQWKKDNLMS